MSSKLTPPISSPIDSQSWLLWHKDLGSYLTNTVSIKSQNVTGASNKLNYNISGSMMNIQYYGPASTVDSTIVVALPVQCKNRSIVDMYYSDGSSTTIVIEANSKNFTIPVNTKDLEDMAVHIQGQVFIVT